MQPDKNPSNERIKEIIFSSNERAAKWLKDTKTGDMYFWQAEKAFHRNIAEQLGIKEYEKGIAVND